MVALGGNTPGGDLLRVARPSRRRLRRLRRVVRGQIAHLVVGEVRRERRHLGIHPPLVAEQHQLPVEIEQRLPGQRRRPGIGGVAVDPVARRAHGGLAPARVDIGGAGRRGDQARDQGQREGETITPQRE